MLSGQCPPYMFGLEEVKGCELYFFSAVNSEVKLLCIKRSQFRWFGHVVITPLREDFCLGVVQIRVAKPEANSGYSNLGLSSYPPRRAGVSADLDFSFYIYNIEPLRREEVRECMQKKGLCLKANLGCCI